MRSAVLLFLKYPAPGRVKTRLAATVGNPEAVAAYRTMVAHVCRQLPAAAEIFAFFDPPGDEVQVRQWVSELLARPFHLRPQAPGDLGVRLAAAFGEVFALGAEKAMVVGTDCVEIGPETFSKTDAALEQADVVLGPTHDGGYYLMGLTQPQPELFRGIEWSSPRTLAQTLARAEAAQLRVHRLPVCHDVDDEADWRRAQAWLSGDQ